MPELPLRGWILIGALVTFSIVILSVLYWAQFTGRAGSQRGLVIHNELNHDLVVIVSGVSQHEIQSGEAETFVVKRDQFPTTISWADTDAADSLIGQVMTYRDVADAEFRISIDGQGIHPTATYRDDEFE